MNLEEGRTSLLVLVGGTRHPSLREMDQTLRLKERHFLTHPTALSPFLLFFLSHKTSPLPTAKPFSPSAHNHLLFISIHKRGKTLCWIFCPQMERKRDPSLSASLRHLVSKAFLQQPLQGARLCLLKVGEALEARFLSSPQEGRRLTGWKAALHTLGRLALCLLSLLQACLRVLLAR